MRARVVLLQEGILCCDAGLLWLWLVRWLTAYWAGSGPALMGLAPAGPAMQNWLALFNCGCVTAKVL